MALGLLTLLLGFVAGCSGKGKGSSVTGKVTYNGAAVTGGIIKLHPASGNPIAIALNPLDGSFKVGDVPPGSYQVSFNTDNIADTDPSGIPPGMKLPEAVKPPDVGPPPGKSAPKRVNIPARYKEPATSNETWEVKAGVNKRDFNLTD